MPASELQDIASAIRDIPDFPKPGILFKDITPVLLNPGLFRKVILEFCGRAREAGAEKIAGIDARGFLFGATVAFELGLGFVPVRKKGKLPFTTFSESYDLEYGSAEIEIHSDAFTPGEKVVLVDDLLATGGTAAAAVSLVHKAGARVTAALFLIELSDLEGRKKLDPVPSRSLLSY